MEFPLIGTRLSNLYSDRQNKPKSQTGYISYSCSKFLPWNPPVKLPYFKKQFPKRMLLLPVLDYNKLATEAGSLISLISVIKCKWHNSLFNDIPPLEPTLQATILDKINGTSGPPLPPFQWCQNGAFLLLRAFIIALVGGRGLIVPFYSVQDCSPSPTPRICSLYHDRHIDVK